MTSPASTNNDDIKALVVNAFDSAKALITYINNNPGKLTDLKNEIKARFTTDLKIQLAKLIF
jgi:hypothetical protein